MCVVSMVTDYWKNNDQWKYNGISSGGLAYNPVSREEFEQLRKEMMELKELLKAAKEKKGRGRPRKNPLPDPSTPKRGRGHSGLPPRVAWSFMSAPMEDNGGKRGGRWAVSISARSFSNRTAAQCSPARSSDRFTRARTAGRPGARIAGPRAATTISATGSTRTTPRSS